ncbi:MAG: hypothetical protein FRX48_09103 [Lasallia pustulata]|uniref:Uncharacterized protein n=1 Tax=Lasallia pustulata TaxID=136370 RepID=A0A5M8PCK9_9LECA|nr:MAG: hypothetical protein FRX48_09103 [Lasallia pustulata]
MRAPLKAAVVLVPALAFALVIPEGFPPISPSRHGVELFPPLSQLQQSPSDALINFVVPCNNCYPTNDGRTGQDQVFHFRVLPVERPCGTNDLWLNDQPLFSHWNGITAQGVQLVEAAGASQVASKDFYVSWNITCLFNALREDGASSQGEDVAQVLKLKIHGLGPEEDDLGFTVSYKQLGAPAILRLSPEVEHLEATDGHAESWRNPSVLLDPTYTSWDDTTKDDAIAKSEGRLPGIELLTTEGSPRGDASGCRGLQCTLQWTLAKAGNAMRKMCSSLKPGTSMRPHCSSAPAASDSISHDELDVGDMSSDHVPSTHHNTSRNDPSAPFPTSFPTIPASSPTPTEIPPAKAQRTDQILRAVRITSLIIILVSLLVILAAHLMHPRRRADRAASREERRNKRLYRCAARRQKWRNWVGKFRRGDPAGRWQEKQTALAQRAGSENATVMYAGITELRDAHTVVSDLVRAEEGRGLADIAELDGRERRRDRRRRRRGSSLPGYESEESGPPAYEVEDKVFVVDGVAVVDGVWFGRAGGVQDTPDSSVVETSPRISMELARSEGEADGDGGKE